MFSFCEQGLPSGDSSETEVGSIVDLHEPADVLAILLRILHDPPMPPEEIPSSELDTYVNWDNMYRFLAQFNPKTPHYFGSPVWPKKRPVFAHGGSGFVLSRGALNKLVARGRMFAENKNSPGTHLFGKDVKSECCGDEVLARVLKECGVAIRGYWPMFNGEKPVSMPFNREQWCEAIITLHHVQADEHDAMKAWETTRHDPSTPLNFEKLFGFIQSKIAAQVDDWSNMSEDITFNTPDHAAKTFDTCSEACVKDKSCIQYEHFGDTCRLGYSIRLGQRHDPDGSKKWTSGWMMGRIEEFQTGQGPCAGAHFVHANP